MVKNLIAIGFAAMATLALAHPSVSIIMDSKGNVYYSDLKQVLKIDPHGRKTVVVRNVHTHELYLDAGDNLYGEHLWYNGESTDAWEHYVWKLSPGGKLDKIIPDTGGLRTDYSFVRDMQGHMYWADQSTSCQKITRKNTDGSLTTLGDQCLQNIRWMTCTANGTIYLIDHHDLKKIDTQGHITIMAEHLPDKKVTAPFVNPDHYLSGISVDLTGNIYVADYSGLQVKKVTPSKQVTVTATTRIPWSPAGTLMAPNGDFWLLECSVTNEVRVEKITPDGKRSVY